MKIVLAIVIALCLCGCDDNHGPYNGETWCVKIHVFEGHKYIKYGNGYGCSIIHAESCPCKQGGRK